MKYCSEEKAMELMQLLEHCDDGDFVDAVCADVASCDYAALDNLEDAENENT